MSYPGPPPGPQDPEPQGHPGQYEQPTPHEQPHEPPYDPSQYGQPGSYGQPSPYGEPGGYGQPGAYGQSGGYGQAAAYGQPGPYASPSTSGKATASLVLGIVSLCGSFLFGIPAIILGIVARKDIKQSQGRLSGDGLAVGGIITGIIGTLISLVFLGLVVVGVAFSSSVHDSFCDQVNSDSDPSNDCA